MVSAYTEIGNCRLIDLSVNTVASSDLPELCNRISWDEEARVVLIYFDSGINEMLENTAESGSFSEAVAGLKQPVIAGMHGDAIGKGLELALACDIRIGSTHAHFGLDQIRKGWIPSNGGTQRLPRLIGQAKAMQMILTGEPIDAAEACRLGLLHRAVEPGKVMDIALGLAQEMAAKSPISLSYVKEALYSGRDLALDQGLKLELDLYLLLFTTFDRTEGVNAFRQKRKPEFRGN